MPVIERTKHDIYPFISPSDGLKGSANGRTVLVTGGGKGIGKAIATQFALAGASTVIISGRSVPPLEETKSFIEATAPHCTVHHVSADVTSEASVQKLFDSLPKTPDVLVNNSGISLSQTSIVDSDVNLWWNDFETNVKGLYLCTRAYLRALAGGPGVIINVSSGVADVVAPNLSSYSATKNAVNRITEFVHAEHAKQGVRCIAFHPGGIASTGMGQAAPMELRSRLHDTGMIPRQVFSAGALTGHRINVTLTSFLELAAGTALYLSMPCAAYLDGRYVIANWDLEQVEMLKDEIVQEHLLISRIRYGERLSTNLIPPS